VIHDRDPLFPKAFIAIPKAGGVKSVKIPAQSPNCNPYVERLVKSIKHECLNHFVIFGERHLRHLIKEFVEHYMTDRFHQGIAAYRAHPLRSGSLVGGLSGEYPLTRSAGTRSGRCLRNRARPTCEKPAFR